ncbi:MAG: hypothetical protein H6822_35875 [Planctomycetaceae bacterium]|nr:hypothetical protein [Planctomycetales bacterium]MCB9927569.1 hypothetical protein [Planctomycetaceae bacterium]
MSSEQDNASENPYEPVEFSIASLFKLVAVVVISLAIFMGHFAVLLAADFGLMAIAIPTVVKVRQIAGIHVPTLTVVEWLAIAFALMMLHLMFTPII